MAKKPLQKLVVVAGKHGPVAHEDNSRRFIGSEPFEVELSAYYLRRLADGELVEAKSKKDKADK
jgi:hypothetical protein